VVHDCHAVDVEVSLTGTIVSEVMTVEVFLPTGQLEISAVHEVMVYILVSMMVVIDNN
jgi:hypothetical protein